eukprot:2324918-Rhodomonas_salina.1
MAYVGMPQPFPNFAAMLEASGGIEGIVSASELERAYGAADERAMRAMLCQEEDAPPPTGKAAATGRWLAPYIYACYARYASLPYPDGRYWGYAIEGYVYPFERARMCERALKEVWGERVPHTTLAQVHNPFDCADICLLFERACSEGIVGSAQYRVGMKCSESAQKCILVYAQEPLIPPLAKCEV